MHINSTNFLSFLFLMKQEPFPVCSPSFPAGCRACIVGWLNAAPVLQGAAHRPAMAQLRADCPLCRRPFSLFDLVQIKVPTAEQIEAKRAYDRELVKRGEAAAEAKKARDEAAKAAAEAFVITSEDEEDEEDGGGRAGPRGPGDLLFKWSPTVKEER
jgi:hypothetical protein